MTIPPMVRASAHPLSKTILARRGSIMESICSDLVDRGEMRIIDEYPRGVVFQITDEGEEENNC